MRHIRINDLAKELGIKSKHVLLMLPVAGISGNKNHSSSLNLEEADSVRAYLRAHPVELPRPRHLQEVRTVPRKFLPVSQPNADCKVGKALQRMTKGLATAKNASASPGTQSKNKKRKKHPNKSRASGLKRTKSKGMGSISRIYGWLERSGWPYNS